MEVTPSEVEAILKSLAETTFRLADMTSGLDNAQLHFKSDKQSWSANDILAHLRSCADVWGKSIETMLAEDTPTLPHISPRTWIRKTNYLQLEFHPSFQVFVDQRRELLVVLHKLRFEEWQRAALIQARKHTVFSQARRMAHHEQLHCEQIALLLENKGVA